MLIFCDDGEGGAGAFPWTEHSNPGVAHGSGKDGNYSLMTSGGGVFCRKIFSTTYTELFFSFFAYFSNLNSARMLSWWSGSTELGSVRWNQSNKHFEIYTGTTLQVTGAVTQHAANNGGTWFNLNVRVLLHDSTGIIDVRHEGSTSSDAIFNGDTLPSGTNMDRIQMGDHQTGHNYHFDNLWVNDTTGSYNTSWPGVMRCSTQFPTGKSATNDSWTADSGTNKYDRINETQVNGNNYIYSETTGNKQGFTYAAPVITGTIRAVVFYDLVQKISSGGVKQGLRIGGTDYPSSTKTLLTAYGRESMLIHMTEENPNGPAAWTTSDNPESYLEKTA